MLVAAVVACEELVVVVELKQVTMVAVMAADLLLLQYLSVVQPPIVLKLVAPIAVAVAAEGVIMLPEAALLVVLVDQEYS